MTKKKVKTRKPTTFAKLRPGFMFAVHDPATGQYGPCVYMLNNYPNSTRLRRLNADNLARGYMFVTKIGAEGFTTDAVDFCGPDAKVLRVVPGSAHFSELLDRYHKQKHSRGLPPGVAGAPTYAAKMDTTPRHPPPVAVGACRTAPPMPGPANRMSSLHEKPVSEVGKEKPISDRPASSVTVRSESVHIDFTIPRGVFDHARQTGSAMMFVVPVK